MRRPRALLLRSLYRTWIFVSDPPKVSPVAAPLVLMVLAWNVPPLMASAYTPEMLSWRLLSVNVRLV